MYDYCKSLLNQGKVVYKDWYVTSVLLDKVPEVLRDAYNVPDTLASLPCIISFTALGTILKLKGNMKSLAHIKDAKKMSMLLSDLEKQMHPTIIKNNFPTYELRINMKELAPEDFKIWEAYQQDRLSQPVTLKVLQKSQEAFHTFVKNIQQLMDVLNNKEV